MTPGAARLVAEQGPPAWRLRVRAEEDGAITSSRPSRHGIGIRSGRSSSAAGPLGADHRGRPSASTDTGEARGVGSGVLEPSELARNVVDNAARVDVAEVDRRRLDLRCRAMGRVDLFQAAVVHVLALPDEEHDPNFRAVRARRVPADRRLRLDPSRRAPTAAGSEEDKADDQEEGLPSHSMIFRTPSRRCQSTYSPRGARSGARSLIGMHVRRWRRRRIEPFTGWS